MQCDMRSFGGPEQLMLEGLVLAHARNAAVCHKVKYICVLPVQVFMNKRLVPGTNFLVSS